MVNQEKMTTNELDQLLFSSVEEIQKARKKAVKSLLLNVKKMGGNREKADEIFGVMRSSVRQLPLSGDVVSEIDQIVYEAYTEFREDLRMREKAFMTEPFTTEELDE